MRLKVPEKAEQAAIVRLLASLGAKVYVLGTRRPAGDYQGTRQTPGLPDVLAFLPLHAARRGHFEQSRELLAIEVKAKGGRLRPEQVVFRELCQQASVAHVVGGLDAVIAWLTARGYLKGAA
jgi:hypothetical protein